MRSFFELFSISVFLLLPVIGRAQLFDERGGLSMEAENFYLQGAALQDEDDWEAAAKFYKESVAADRTLQKAWFNLGLVNYQLGNYKEAETALETLLELAPEDTGAYELYGMVLHQLGHFDRAIACYNLVMGAKNSDILYVNRALAYLSTGRTKTALQDLDEALRLNPSNFSACLGKGVALSELGQSELALSWIEHALELKPGHPDAMTNRAIIRFREGDQEKAMEDFRSALSACKKSSIYMARARCYLQEGKPGEAWHDLHEALHYSPGSSELFELMGDVEWERGNYPAAIESFSKAIETDPACSDCYFKRSKIHLQNRQLYEAVADLYRVIENAPFNQMARECLLETYSQLDRENLATLPAE